MVRATPFVPGLSNASAANTVSLYELNGDRGTLLVMNATCIARLVLEPTIRVVAIRSNPYLPAQFVLLTADGALHPVNAH